MLFPVYSLGEESCDECRRLILSGTEHYACYKWEYDEVAEKAIRHMVVCCEECGDLALNSSPAKGEL